MYKGLRTKAAKIHEVDNYSYVCKYALCAVVHVYVYINQPGTSSMAGLDWTSRLGMAMKCYGEKLVKEGFRICTELSRLGVVMVLVSMPQPPLFKES